MRILPVRLLVRIDHLDDSTNCYRFKDDIEQEDAAQGCKGLSKVIFMGKLCYGSEELIILLEDIDVGKGNLVYEHHKKPKHPHERRNEIQFLERMEVRDGFPGWEYDGVFHRMLKSFAHYPRKKSWDRLSSHIEDIGILDTHIVEDIVELWYIGYNIEWRNSLEVAIYVYAS